MSPVLRHLSRAVHSVAAQTGRLDWTHDTEAAREAQALLSRARSPVPPGLEVGVWYEPARDLSGDFYEVLTLADSRVAFLVGDVSGKGAPAALIGASLQASLQSQLTFDGDLCRALGAANAHLYERTAPQNFATLFLGVYHASSNTLRFVNCGHNPPLLVRADGTLVRMKATATILGAFRSWECSSDAIRLHPGDLLLAFTDGLTESRDRQEREYGERGLLRAVQHCRSAPLPRIIETIAAANRRFRRGERQDDVTLLAARAARQGGRTR
jgi:sigma-B regulation protein RsbU (phosphoserine phosphatase)